jgi:hypothetical protein
LSSPFAANANRRFEFQKRAQLFIRTDNEALSVVAMRVNNPDLRLQVWKRREPSGKSPPPDSDLFDAEFGKNLDGLSRQSVDERSQLFFRTQNVTVAAIAAIMVSIVRSIGGYKPPFPIPKTHSAFHRPVQRTGFRRRGVHLQQRLVVRYN